MPQLSIIIPAYNEQQRITPTLTDLAALLPTIEPDHEIIVVDDGSTDATYDTVRRLSRDIPRLWCIPSRPNRGKGHAVRVGMLEARGRIRVMLDADGSIGPHQLPALLAPLRERTADIAIGSRYVAGARTDRAQPFYRRWWSRFANRIVQRLVVPGIADTQCGFKAFTAQAAHAVFARARIDGWAFDLEALALAHHLGLTVRELPIEWTDDPRSRINPVRDAWRVTREMFAIRGNLRAGAYGRLELAAASLPGM